MRNRRRKVMSKLKETNVEVKSRKEMEMIPQGVSCTETDGAWYIRIRFNKKNHEIIIGLRIDKETFKTSSKVDIEEWPTK